MSLNPEDLRQVERILDQFKGDEIHLEIEDFVLVVRRKGADLPPLDPAVETGAPAVPSRTPGDEEPVEASAPSLTKTPKKHFAKPPSATALAVAAPVSGTLYRAPAPGADSFVEPGSKVRRGDTLCIIEVMKVMTHVTTEQDGTVVRVDVDNAQSLEAGQAILWIEPG